MWKLKYLKAEEFVVKKKKTNSENSSSKIFSVMYKIMHNYN